MTEPDPAATPLDVAHARMAASPEADALRLGFYERVCDCELFLLLAGESPGGTLAPQVFALAEGPVVLAFDREERLAAFAGGPASHAAMPGRDIVQMLAGQGMALGLNFGAARSATMLPSEVVDWLAGMLEHRLEELSGTVAALSAPTGLSPQLIAALDAKLARAGGLADAALLAAVAYADGTRGHLLAILGAAPGAETALARALGEAITFGGHAAAAFDVAFLDPGDPLAQRLAPVALRFDLPAGLPPDHAPRSAPGSDPDKPPILR